MHRQCLKVGIDPSLIIFHTFFNIDLAKILLNSTSLIKMKVISFLKNVKIIRMLH